MIKEITITLMSMIYSFYSESPTEDLPEPKTPLQKSELRAAKFDQRVFSETTAKFRDLMKEGEYKIGESSMAYRLFAPGKTPGKVPLVIFLHGFGDQADTLKHPQFLNFISPTEQKKLPCFLLVPQLPKDFPYWGGIYRGIPAGSPVLPASETVMPTPNQSLVMGMIRDLMKNHPQVDPERVYLTGLSSGGSACFCYAEVFPGHFAGLVPVCGGMPQILEGVKTPQKLAIWAFLNKNEEADVRKSCGLLLDRYKAWGNKELRFTTFEDAGVGGHSAWNWAYAEPDLPEWLFKNKRVKPAPGSRTWW